MIIYNLFCQLILFIHLFQMQCLYNLIYSFDIKKLTQTKEYLCIQILKKKHFLIENLEIKENRFLLIIKLKIIMELFILVEVLINIL